MAPSKQTITTSPARLSCHMTSPRVTCVFVAYVVVCLWSSVAACGEDPMTNINSIAQSKGVSPESILRYIQTYSPDRYVDLVQLYSRYKECLGRIDTGYFKRDAPVAPRAPFGTDSGHDAQVVNAPDLSLKHKLMKSLGRVADIRGNEKECDCGRKKRDSERVKRGAKVDIK